jgi:hypothetical protein
MGQDVNVSEQLQVDGQQPTVFKRLVLQATHEASAARVRSAAQAPSAMFAR